MVKYVELMKCPVCNRNLVIKDKPRQGHAGEKYCMGCMLTFNFNVCVENNNEDSKEVVIASENKPKKPLNVFHPKTKYSIIQIEDRKPLTYRQGEVLVFILKHIEKKGYPPAMGDMAKYFGWGVQTTARDHLEALESKGYIRRIKYQARGIVIIIPE